MENLTNIINLREIHYPVYRLGTEKPNIIDGISFYYRQYKNEWHEIKHTLRVIDDTNLPEKTLATRRIHLLKMEVKLKRISEAMFFLGDFIKLAHRSTWFIDSMGKIFQYKKSKSIKLTFKKVTKLIPIPSGGAIVEVEGMATRFKTLYVPDIEHNYAGLLKDGMGYILYGFYTEKLNDSWRMV